MKFLCSLVHILIDMNRSHLDQCMLQNLSTGDFCAKNLLKIIL